MSGESASEGVKNWCRGSGWWFMFAKAAVPDGDYLLRRVGER